MFYHYWDENRLDKMKFKQAPLDFDSYNDPN